MNTNVCALFMLLALMAGPLLASDNKAAADLLYDEALGLIDSNQNQAAIDLLQQVVALQPDHAGAWLDLAMMNCRIGNIDATQQQLELLETRFNPTPQIRQIISQIQQTDCAGYASTAEALQLARQGVLRAEFAVGLDDNVNQGLNNGSFSFNQGGNAVELQVDPSFRPREDQFVQADVIYQNSGLSGYLQLRENLTESEFNLLSGYLGYESSPRLPGINLRLGGAVGALTLGGSLYQTTYQLSSQITPALLQTDWLGTRLVSSVSQVKYPSLAGADAQLMEVGIENVVNGTRYTVATRVDYTFDNALKNRAGGDRTGLGYNLELIKPLELDYTLRLGLSQRQTLSANSFSPGFFDTRRSQLRTSYSITLSRPLGKTSTLKLNVRKTMNQENITLFEYDNTIARLSVSWNFN